MRKLILMNVAPSSACWSCAGSPRPSPHLVRHLVLVPRAVFHGEIWQLLTYVFFEQGLLDILFNNLILWFLGSLLEASYGSRWFGELYFSASSAARSSRPPSPSPTSWASARLAAAGAWSGIFGLLVAFAMIFGDQEFLLWFPSASRRSTWSRIYIFVALAILLKSADPFTALLSLSGGLCGYLYVKFAPRRGLAFGFSEQYYSIRNGYYRWKRRRAARKFEVYMGKQGRNVKFDSEGRYINPDEVRKNPNDKRWMN